MCDRLALGERRELGRQSLAGLAPVHRLDHRHHFLAISSCGAPITATSATLGWVMRRFLDLLRVNVHAAGNDHEALTGR